MVTNIVSMVQDMFMLDSMNAVASIDKCVHR